MEMSPFAVVAILVVLVMVAMSSGRIRSGKSSLTGSLSKELKSMGKSVKNSSSSLGKLTGNKMLMGILVGFALCWAYGKFRMEGMGNIPNKEPCLNDTECKSGYCHIDPGSGGKTCHPETRPQKEINAQAERMDSAADEMCMEQETGPAAAAKALMCSDASASLIWNEQCPDNTCP